MKVCIFHERLLVLTGSMKDLNAHTKRARGSMSRLLSLQTVPDMTPDLERLEKLKSLRDTLLPGETEIVWAVQSGDEHTRQALPRWIGEAMGKLILKWADEKVRWDQTRAEREMRGKQLTACQQKRFDEFQRTSEIKLLFNRQEQKVVPRLKSAAELRLVHETMFSLQITLEGAPDQLTVRAGSGEALPLVMLRGEPLVGETALPGAFAGGVADEVLEVWQEVEPELEHVEEGVDEQAELQEFMQEDDIQEFMAQTSDEEEIRKVASGPFVRVKDFCARQAFRNLDAKGLTIIPVHIGGVFLSYHKGSRTWQGSYASKGCCFSHGGSTNRASASLWVAF